MGRVILGEMKLRWCPKCNVPLIEMVKCGLCQGQTFAVKHTPPGDIRPGFEGDAKLIRDVIGSQFGNEASLKLLPTNSLFLLNSVPGIDKMDEVIVHGYPIGNLKYNPMDNTYSFILRQDGLKVVEKHVKSNFVVVDKGAIPFIKKGANCLAPGIKKVVGDFSKGDEMLVFDPLGVLLMSGTAKMDSAEMVEAKSGVAIRSRHRFKKDTDTRNCDGKDATWEMAVEANMATLNRFVDRSTRFIKRTIERIKLPFAVSYSGGKDSLATLMLVLDAGFKPPLLFINTGLEFPETVDNVNLVVEKYGLELITLDVGDAFFHALKHFGPPAKDFRWCCKICKLGPATRLIGEKYPKGVLSFIGQRQFESEQRMEKGDIWDNPWVPNQKGASPIQTWNALTVWLYLFKKNAPHNPWYERGLERIGCWCCPSAPMAELRRIRKEFRESERFFGFVEEWAEKRGFSPQWSELGLWRWKKYPGSVKELMRNKNISLKELIGINNLEHGPGDTNRMDLVADISPNQEDLEQNEGEGMKGVWKEKWKGKFTKKISLSTIMPLTPILGKSKYTGEGKDIHISTPWKREILIKENGVEIIIQGEKIPDWFENDRKDVIGVVKRALYCTGCGVCTGRCPHEALFLASVNGKLIIRLDTEKCVGCRKCLGPCPVVNFEPETPYRI